MLKAVKNPVSGSQCIKLESFMCHISLLQLYLVHINCHVCVTMDRDEMDYSVFAVIL